MRFPPRERIGTAGIVVAVVVAAYGLGSMLGSKEAPVADGPQPAASPSAAMGGGPPPGGGPGALPASQLAANQPVTGPGDPPLANSGAGPFGSLRMTGQGFVALTFDDGPDPRWTPEVLRLLREHNARATFCVLGSLAEAHPELIREIVDDGHTLCNHTWQHDMALGSRSRGAIREDLARTMAAIRKAAPGSRVSYYRQPGGNWTARVIEVAEELGMSSLHWDVDPQDWRKVGPGTIASAVTSTTRRGSIVLLHDGGGSRGSTVRALPTILPDLAGRLRLEALPPGVDPPRLHGRELPLKPGQI